MKKIGCRWFLMFLLLPVVSAHAAVPMIMNYQGTVTDALGAPINGDGYFKFAIVDQSGANATTAYWVNNGTIGLAEPTAAVQVTVSNGVFSVKLGDIGITNMAALTQSIFDNSSLYLRVWFSTTNANFEQFDADIQIASTGFAFKSAVADRALVADEVTNIDPTAIQTRVAGTCDASETIIAINQDGSVVCDIDQGQTYTAGSGISIASGIISVDTAGLNADTLDNLDSTNFASSGHVHDGSGIIDGSITNADINASAAISATKIDRTGLSADTLDGIDSAGFASSDHTHNYAGSSSAGGPASDVSCTSCVSGTDIAANSIDGTRLAPGSVTVPGSAFRSGQLDCTGTAQLADGFHFIGGTDCRAVAPVYLPDGVTVTGGTCYGVDFSTSESFYQFTFANRQFNATTSAAISATAIDLTTLPFSSASVQAWPLSSSSFLVNNSAGVYVIQVRMQAVTALSALSSIRGCTIFHQ